jgi:membrane fusion protein, multidrug efflux system
MVSSIYFRNISIGMGLGLLLAACSGAKPEPPAPAVFVVQPSADGVALNAYSGDVRAREEPALAFRIGGKVSRRLVDAGARVSAGQALAELDASDVRLQTEASGAALASAQSQLALAKAELDRHKNLYDQQLISRSLYETRKAQYDAAAAQVRQARAQANVSGNQADYAVLRAPKSGVIAQRMVEVGQVVAAGQTAFVLAVDGEREVAISVAESQIEEFKPGRELFVELWAAPGKRFVGKLREISPSADPLARTYAARVSFKADDVNAEVGQSARVFAAQSSGAAINVPLGAVTELNQQSIVWVVRDGKVKATPVTVGAFNENSVPIQSGLQPNEWVVAAGVHLLRDNMKVTPVDQENRRVDMAAGAPAVAKAAAR